MRVSILGFLSVLLLSAPWAQATIYDLDPVNGSSPCVTSGQTGCNATACKSWAALTGTVSLRAGDTINFCDGTYRETVTLTANGAVGNPITLKKAAGAANATISGLDFINGTSWTSQGSGVYTTPFTAAAGCTNAPQRLAADDVFLQKNAATGCPATLTTLPAGKWCYDSTNARVALHLTGDVNPNTHKVEVGQRVNNILLTNRSNITVDGLTLYASEGSCTTGNFAIEADNTAGDMKIANNTIKYAGKGMRLTGGATTGSDLITGNIFTHIGDGWSYPSDTNIFSFRVELGTPAVTITNNQFIDNGTHMFPAAGLTLNCAHNGTTGYTAACWSDSINGFVGHTGSGPTLLHIDDNIMTNVEGGIALKVFAGSEMAKGSTVSRNTLYGWSHPVNVTPYSASMGIRVYCTTTSGGWQLCSTAPVAKVHELLVERNTVINFPEGIGITLGNLQPGDNFVARVANNISMSGSRLFSHQTAAGMWIGQGSDGLQIYNNTVKCDKNTAFGGSLLDIGHAYQEASSGNVSADFRNNIFDGTGCTAKITDLSTTDTWNTADNICDTAVSGSCSAASPALTYANAASNDFHLASADTAAINKGLTLTGFTTDIDGDTRPQPAGGAWDIGADEYSTAAVGLVGDLDGNTVVDVLDLQRMVNVLLGLETDPTVVQRADLDGVGGPTILDLQRLVNLLLGV